ncbi:hypothetical protein VPNG_02908 [Cytospora leucostoma]|uniref:Uncharacterized protein n=1 Tax=Cytospora leucostoma TaxID=1230097 RepID=A0A423XG69_9PEZI|nr:hypothetical protein VPNG_02908 [Cytospora leucostoma]
MVRGRKYLPPDPRPSRAHPEHRAHRKQLEKEHGYGWVPPVVLGLLGITLAFDVTKDVEKTEERHKREDAEEEERKRRRGRRRRDGDGKEKGKGKEDTDRSRRYDDDRGDDDGGYEGGYGDDSRYGGRDGGLVRGDRLERGEGGGGGGGSWERQGRRRRLSAIEAGYDDDYYDEDDRSTEDEEAFE